MTIAHAVEIMERHRMERWYDFCHFDWHEKKERAEECYREFRECERVIWVLKQLSIDR